GMRSARLTRWIALAGAPALLLGLGEFLARASHTPTIVEGGFVCYRRELAVAVPASFMLAWLLSRSYTLHPVFVAISGTFGVGLVADTALHLACPATNVSHTLVVHGGVVLTLAAVGAAVGYWKSRRL